MKKSCFFVLSAIAMVSCQNSEDYHNISIKNKYAIALPPELTKAVHLNDSASLQYQDLFKEFYIVILDESKDKFDSVVKSAPGFSPDLDGYTKILRSGLERTVSYPEFTPVRKVRINGMDARVFSLTGKVDNFNIYYQFAYVQGKTTYYQIVTWTEKKRKQQATEKMDKMIASFREIPKRG